MALTVITLKNTSNSLRGDLTKWMQEVSQGVYVGSFNRKVREELWERVKSSTGTGEATLTYHTNNEIGYNFETYNSRRKTVDYEGIPLVMIPKSEENVEKKELGFSKAAKYKKMRKYSTREQKVEKTLVYIDIETDGLDYRKNNIIEIGGIKVKGKEIEEFHKLIKTEYKLPKEITQLTGIKDEDLEKGVNINTALKELLRFVQDYDIIGYNIQFDLRFLNHNLKKIGLSRINNRVWDIMHFVKKEKPFIESYKLESVLKEYGIDVKVPHRGLKDAILTYQLSLKVHKFWDQLKQERLKIQKT